MAGNEWIGGYLDAILDSGHGPGQDDISRAATSIGAGKEALTAAKYFVNEVTGHDDAALYRTWVKASATKYPQERGSRMEYLCWRIWHIARKKKQLEWEDAQNMARRHVERQRGQKEAIDEMSNEDLSEGEKEKFDMVPELATIAEDSEMLKCSPAATPAQPKDRKLYMVLISLHGLVRGDQMELGRDSDTGGQVKYVVELARALALMPEVYRVDLFTRQICDPNVDWSYGEPTEMLTAGQYTEEGGESGESSGAYIVRIPCGPRDEYVRKELLWPYIQEFVDGALSHVLNMAKVLGDQIAGGEPVWPHVIHGHYADAGDAASLLSGALDVPMVLTGHSLGRNKLEQLLKGRESRDNINHNYKIMRRIEGEELALDAAELVITSTRQEIEEQWGLYDGFNVRTERALRGRARRGISCHGRYMPRMVVITPGMDFSNVIVQDASDIVEDADHLAFTSPDAAVATPVSSLGDRAEPPIWAEIMRFFTNPHKPMILALARPDPKKNITKLLAAFGESRQLRELANLVLIMGNRDDIDNMSGGNATVLLQVLKLIDKYDLYGQVAYPKHHRQSDVPEIYRLAAKTKGVFINPALVEPFGLTLIEAAAHGLPMVATKNGGPVDILKALSNGLIVDPHNQKEIADALLKLVSERNLWVECRRNGLKNIHVYSWPEHCRTYLSKIAQCRIRHPQWQNDDTTADDDADDVDSLGDSLRDLKDMSLRLSLDGDRMASMDLEKILAKYGNGKDGSSGEPQQQQAKAAVRNTLGRMESLPEDNKVAVGGGAGNGVHTSKVSILRRRKRLVIIAIDSYDESGKPTEQICKSIQEIFKAVRADSTARSTGFILSTCLSAGEAVNLLNAGGISVHEFDAVIVGSGSELHYPAGNEEAGTEGALQADPDYDTHIDYRWGGDGLRKTLQKVTAPDEPGQDKGKRALTEDEGSFNAHSFAYKVVQPSLAPTVDQIRQRLRQRGLRCHVMYCQNVTKMRVIPLLASRSQALRYLFVRWGLDVVNMYVFVGETGDTDHEELLSGTHKTIVLKGVVTSGCERLLRVGGSYQRGDVAPAESPYILTTECNAEQISGAMKKLSSVS